MYLSRASGPLRIGIAHHPQQEASRTRGSADHRTDHRWVFLNAFGRRTFRASPGDRRVGEAVVPPFQIETMTNLRTIKKPTKDEYPPYSIIYMELLEDDGLVLQHLNDSFLAIKEFIYALPEEKLYLRYAEGKWSIKEILVHIVDDERIFAYRALRYARGDKTELHGFEQEDYTFFSDA